MVPVPVERVEVSVQEEVTGKEVEGVMVVVVVGMERGLVFLQD